MEHPLDEAYARWERAWANLKELNEKTRIWVLANRYDFVPEFDRKLNRPVIVARSPDPANPIGRVPLELGIIAGDAINNLRSALNYIVWRLALKRGATNDQLQFPIVHDFGTKAYPKKAALRFPDVVKRYHLDLVGDENLAFIERMQPYHGGHWLPLAFLADLNDMDKHRVLATHQHSVAIDWPKFYGVGAGSVVSVEPKLYEGARVVTFQKYVAHSDPKVQMNFRPPATVMFGPAAGRMGNTGALRDTAMLVHRILWVFHDRA
jgi:hypothetical protein